MTELACLFMVGLLSGFSAYVVMGGPLLQAQRARKVWDAVATPLSGIGRLESKERRRGELVKQIPTFFDIVTLGLSAGLSFDASLELYCTRYRSELADSVNEALLSWRIGTRGRGEALRDLALELDVPALERFAATVSEALAFGTPLSDALEHQAQAIRDDQRSHMEEEIERAPVKMLIPLGVLIVPAMLIAILGPLLGSALGMA